MTSTPPPVRPGSPDDPFAAMTAADIRADRCRVGSGPPPVLLHGICETWRSWTPVLAGLAAERDVYALTLPGHLGGRPFPAGVRPSLDQWITSICDELDGAGLDRPDLVGNSLGGWLAMELAKRGRANSVIAIAPAGLMTPDETSAFVRHFRTQHRLVRAGLPVLRILVRAPLARRLLLTDNCAHPQRVAAGEARHLLEAFAFSDFDGFVDGLRDHEGQIRQLDNAHEVTCPVLLLWGTRDRVLPLTTAARWADQLPDARLIELPDCGHTAMFDDPDRIVGEVLAFTTSHHVPSSNPSGTTGPSHA